MNLKKMLSIKNIGLFFALKKTLKNTNGDTSVQEFAKEVAHTTSLAIRIKICFILGIFAVIFWFYQPLISAFIAIYAILLIVDFKISNQFLLFSVFTGLLVVIFKNSTIVISFTLVMWVLYNVFLVIKPKEEDTKKDAEALEDKDGEAIEEKDNKGLEENPKLVEPTNQNKEEPLN